MSHFNPHLCFFLSLTVILPRGDQHLELGSPSVDIYCRLNPRHEYARRFGADRMGLYLAGESGGPRRMRTTRINDTTVMATYEPGSSMKMDLVSCKVDLGEGQPRGVCQQNIYVGSKFALFS